MNPHLMLGLISLAFFSPWLWANTPQLNRTSPDVHHSLPLLRKISSSAQTLAHGPGLASTESRRVLKQASIALHQLATKATPAVVSITTIKNHSLMDTSLTSSSPELSQPSLGMGSGVVIKENGTILTNYHVIEGADQVTVWMDDQNKWKAEIMGVDPPTDLAVIQLITPPSKALPYLRFGDSDLLSVGDWILSIGSPYGLVHSVTSGIISALGRTQLGVLDTENFIQTDAAINPGNSGGPLLNTQGEIIGINTAIFSQSGGFSGIGFAIPSNTAKKVLEELLRNGRVIRGWAGISAQDLTEELAQYFHVPQRKGALICDLQRGGPGDLAQLQRGDVVTRYQGKEILSAFELKNQVIQTPIHSKIPIHIVRAGTLQMKELLITEHPEAQTQTQIQKKKKLQKNLTPTPYFSTQQLGIQTQDLSSEIAQALQIPAHSGVIIRAVRLGSPGFEAGLLAGDLILNVNHTVIHQVKDLQAFLKNQSQEKALIFYIQRGPMEKLFIAVKATR